MNSKEKYIIKRILNYCREPSSCMIVGSNKSYHSMKQSIILHENLDKPLAIVIVGLAF